MTRVKARSQPPHRARANRFGRLGKAALTGFSICLVTQPCAADEQSPDHDITVGPSVAWGFGAKREGPLIVGMEFSYLPGGFFWTTFGGRVLSAETDTTGLLHVEAGIWLFATLGVGYSRRLWGDAFDANSLHLFVGMPLPFAEAFDAGMFFAEPYYRPAFGLSGQSAVHELGLMLKLTTYQ